MKKQATHTKMLEQINCSYLRPIRLIAALGASLVLAGTQTGYAADNSAAGPASGSIDLSLIHI